MANARDIKGRIRAVANIRRITKTMQMIATARFQASQRRASSAQPYTRKIRELVGELSANAGELTHPLLQAPQQPTGRDLILVLSSNRGLCGGYNGHVLRMLLAMHRACAEQDRTLQIEVVGKKGRNYCRFTGIELTQFHAQFDDKPTYEQVNELATRYITEFTDGRYDSVQVIFMAFKSMSRQEAQTLTLLPMAPPMQKTTGETKTPEIPGTPGAGRTVEYDFSPDAETLLNQLLPVAAKTQLFQCFNEAVVCEHIARMIAMKGATDSAGKMGKALTQRYNRARQTAITTELNEIISGAAALS